MWRPRPWQLNRCPSPRPPLRDYPAQGLTPRSLCIMPGTHAAHNQRANRGAALAVCVSVLMRRLERLLTSVSYHCFHKLTVAFRNLSQFVDDQITLGSLLSR